MHIHIQTRGFTLTEGLRAHVERRLQFAMSRFQSRGLRVKVRLSDVNGPRGGLDKLCHLQIRVGGLPDMVIEDTDVDLYAAINRAAERAGRTLQRHLRWARGAFDGRVRSDTVTRRGSVSPARP